MQNLPPEPPELPKVHLPTLWTTLLLPPLSVLFFIIASAQTGKESTLQAALFYCPIIAGITWIFYSLALNKRYKGSSLVLLILAYPIAEFVVCFAIFFFGCLNTLNV